MSVMALQTTIFSRRFGLYKTTLARRQRPLGKADRGHHGWIVRVKPWARISSGSV
jgi:hypothetical protein